MVMKTIRLNVMSNMFQNAGLSLNPKPRSPWRPRADWSKHVDRSHRRVIRLHALVIRLQVFWGASQVFWCTGTVFKYASAVTASRLAFHGATERFGWLIVSQQGDSPIDLLITSRTDNPHSSRACGWKVTGLTPPQKVQDSCKSAKILARF